MKNIFRLSLATIFSLIFVFSVNDSFAEKYHGGKSKKGNKSIKANAAGCLPGAGYKYLDINNVRARINTGGDMWWDMEKGAYEIPQGSGKTSMFSASLWIGGMDVNDQLKLAAIRYRSGPDFDGGTDYWTGPLTTDGSASIDAATCAQYDKHFEMTRKLVDEYLAWWNDKASYPDYKIPQAIMNWPAHGDITKGQSYYLAPFFDNDGDGSYDPTQGDYPYYDTDGSLCKSKIPTPEGNGILSDQVIKGDQTLWWVFNDKGNAHTETFGDAIGMEIRGQAFSFSTNDVVNNMTFYSYEIINRSTFTLKDTYFSQWVDTDLGYANDDYVGCDVLRGLGYCYNGREVDGNGQAWAYGEQPPAIGVDFFQGPYIDNDGIDNAAFTGDCSIFDFNLPEGNPDDGSAINGVNFGDGIVDNERYGMRRFVYHNNQGSSYMTDPKYAIEYYNYLRGIWKDNSKMLYGGNAHTSAGGYGPDCFFMFPGDSDPCNWGTKGLEPNGAKYWTEQTAGNAAADRRFMQSAGPFTLKAGAVNYITVGIPWARAASGGAFASVELLRTVDDKCQALFDNCFQVVNGPNAPDVTIQELENKLVLYLTNRKTNDAGNNFRELYEEVDPSIQSPDDVVFDTTYVFEGYQVFQLASADVSVADLDNPTLAREVFQCDIKNKVSKLVNSTYDQNLGASVPKLMVDGSNLGIKHSFVIENDAFSGEALVNHKQYYFLALSYGFNEYMKYSADPGAQSFPVIGLEGQTTPYLAGRKNIKLYTGIPHANVSSDKINSDYGDGLIITRLQGQGNGGNELVMSDESIDALMQKPAYDTSMRIGDEDYPIIYEPTYKANFGPLKIKVIDPLKVKSGSFKLEFDTLVNYLVHNITDNPALEVGGDTATIKVTNWKLTNEESGEVYHSDTTILKDNEQLFLDLGLSIILRQSFEPGIKEIGVIPDNDPSAAPTHVFEVMEESSGMINATMTFADSSNIWLFGMPDTDNPGSSNWIRSGSMVDRQDANNNDWNVWYQGSGQHGNAEDPGQDFESILGGTWAPYNLTAASDQDPCGPAYKIASTYCSKKISKWSNLSSVQVVITANKDKWTRCPVIEMAADEELAEGGAKRFEARKAASVNINGEAGIESTDPTLNSNYIDGEGMGWFPGYAVNLETGERLNMAFGEDSWLVDDNGRDMLWNPSSRVFNNGGYVMGGKHYIYVFSSDSVISSFGGGAIVNKFYNPPYDAGSALKTFIDSTAFSMPPPSIISPKDMAYSTAMWVNIPLANDKANWMEGDVIIRLNVVKPYKRWYSKAITDENVYANTNLNEHYPAYRFTTESVATTQKESTDYDNDLDIVNVVPNPYYGYASYETNQLDNRIKIVNLPKTCTVTIYNVKGTLIRQFSKDEDGTQINWDLKNFAGIPISGGMYYMHVKSDKGERVIKWFGMMRPIDLNAF